MYTFIVVSLSVIATLIGVALAIVFFDLEENENS